MQIKIDLLISKKACQKQLHNKDSKKMKRRKRKKSKIENKIYLEIPTKEEIYLKIMNKIYN